MKKILVLAVFFLFMFSVASFAQIARVIEAKGDVQIKKEPKSTWEKAKINIFLDKQAEIKTGKSSECTLAFDEELKNLLTIKENSEIKIENLKPASIVLPQGRVFSLIDDIAKVEKFEIRTPTAIAGVRGTGESVEFSSGCASVKCFENKVFVQGLTNQGAATGGQALASGFGVKVCEGGTFGEQFVIPDNDLVQWEEFISNVDDLRDNNSDEGADGDSLNDALDERRLDYGNDNLEDRRRSAAGSGQQSGSNNRGRYDKK